MAARLFRSQVINSHEVEIKQVFAKVTFGASGAPTVSAKDSKGIQSITRVSAGKFNVVFGTPGSTQAATTDVYYKLLNATHIFENATAPAAPSMFITSNAVASTGTIQVEFNSAGTTTDPASGEICHLQFIFCDSNT
jgi:hypothetical protein